MTGKRPRCFLGRFRRSYSGRDGIGRERKAVFPRLVRSLSFRILRHGKRTVPAGSPFAGAAIGFSPIPFRPNGIGKGGGSALFPFDGWSMPVRCSGRPLSPYATHRRSGWPFPNPASVLSDHGPRMSALLSLFLRSRRCRPEGAAVRLLFILRNKSSPFGWSFPNAISVLATTDRVCQCSSPCSCAVVGVVRKARRHGFFLYFGTGRRAWVAVTESCFRPLRPRTAYVGMLLTPFLRSRRCRPKSAAARLLFILRNKSSPFGRPFFEAGNPKARKRFRPEGDSPRRVALRPNRFSGRNYPQAGKPAGLSPVRKVRIIFSGSSTPRSFWAGRCCPSRR